VTYFFDNNISFRYANMLRAIRQDVVHVAKTRDFHRDDPDVEWMPKVAERGWIAVTLDEAIRRIAVEEMLRAKLGLRVVFLAEGFRHHGFFDQAKFLINAWPVGPRLVEATNRRRRVPRSPSSGRTTRREHCRGRRAVVS
jgi:PIN like domain